MISNKKVPHWLPTSGMKVFLFNESQNFIIFVFPFGVLENFQAEITPIEPVQVMLKRDIRPVFIRYFIRKMYS